MFEGHIDKWTFSVLFLFVLVLASAELQEVFEPGFTSLHRVYDLQLEDLTFKTKPRPQLMLRNLVLSVSAPPQSIKPRVFYRKAVRNLKLAAPNLETIELNGGYVFNPNNTKNVAELENEIDYLFDYFTAISSAIKTGNLTMKSAIFNIAVVFNKSVKNTSNYEQLLLDKFGESAIIDDSDSDGVEMLIDVNEIEFRVNFAFITDTLVVKKVRLPKGRTPFRKAAEKFLLSLWLKMHRQAQNQTADPFKPLFPNGVHRLANVRQIHLEDFCNECGYPGEQHEMVQLMLGLAVPPPSNTGSVYIFYIAAMQNLKSTLPNLKRVRLAGGYINHPEQNTNLDLIAELPYLRNLLRAVIKAAKQQKVEILGINFRSVLIFPESSFDRKEFAAELKKRFDHEVTDDEIASKDFDFIATIETVRCHIFLSLTEPVPGVMDNLSLGRHHYYPNS
ncbi:hypothetical protein M3Y94_01265100 [Aphelenchoides besseyi]|nr:hypothetical protein M3Y94_01265100 [Aphelenchoides besseyi]